jgi:hypothetical protein
MPKKIDMSSPRQDELIENIRALLFGNKNVCVLCDIDNKPDVQKKVLDLIPDLRMHFLIHNIPGVQRPDSLKRPWLSIMKTFLKYKYHLVSENFLMKTENGVVATKRYILLPKDTIVDTAADDDDSM